MSLPAVPKWCQIQCLQHLLCSLWCCSCVSLLTPLILCSVPLQWRSLIAVRQTNIRSWWLKWQRWPIAKLAQMWFWTGQKAYSLGPMPETISKIVAAQGCLFVTSSRLASDCLFFNVFFVIGRFRNYMLAMCSVAFFVWFFVRISGAILKCGSPAGSPGVLTT